MLTKHLSLNIYSILISHPARFDGISGIIWLPYAFELDDNM